MYFLWTVVCKEIAVKTLWRKMDKIPLVYYSCHATGKDRDNVFSRCFFKPLSKQLSSTQWLKRTFFLGSTSTLQGLKQACSLSKVWYLFKRSPVFSGYANVTVLQADASTTCSQIYSRTLPMTQLLNPAACILLFTKNHKDSDWTENAKYNLGM